MSSRMTADELATLLLGDEAQRRLTRKQAQWLYDVACREAKRRLTHNCAPYAAGNLLPLERCEGWRLSIYHNGAGVLAIIPHLA